jgi:hypothetical protein
LTTIIALAILGSIVWFITYDVKPSKKQSINKDFDNWYNNIRPHQ